DDAKCEHARHDLPRGRDDHAPRAMHDAGAGRRSGHGNAGGGRLRENAAALDEGRRHHRSRDRGCRPAVKPGRGRSLRAAYSAARRVSVNSLQSEAPFRRAARFARITVGAARSTGTSTSVSSVEKPRPKMIAVESCTHQTDTGPPMTISRLTKSMLICIAMG